MKILLKHTRTQLYVRDCGTWTANPIEAHNFQHSQNAMDYAREHNLTAVQIAVRFIDAQFDEVFPIHPAHAATAHVARA